MDYSTSPDGLRFPLPGPEDYPREYERIKEIVRRKRREGCEIVIVMGVGFVGAVMAAVVADSKKGKKKFVIGLQRPSPRSYWKIPYLNRGKAPVKAEDPEVARMIRRCVKDSKTLMATFTYDALEFADVVVVDVQCDYVKESLGNLVTGHADMVALEKCMHVIGAKIPPRALVLIETTVAPGTTEFVALPALKEEFKKRRLKQEPCLAHSFERVMPGRNYVSSIRDFWRVCAGVNEHSRRRVVKFLTEVLNTREYPLTVLDRPIESETTKIVENSYRAALLAYMNEWSLFAERTGVDLTKVIKAIKVRPTHSNIMFPGPGIGGYCLPKDGGLGAWAARNLLGFTKDVLHMTTMAIDINDTRALHAADLVAEALKEMGKKVRGAKVLLLGAAYREDVGDTRYSGSELIVRKLAEMGARMSAHDPYVQHWWEFEKQDTYPSPGHSWARFFKNQAKLKTLRVQNNLSAALRGVDAIVLAVRHKQYMTLAPRKVVKLTGKRLAVVDCFGMLPDARIGEYLRLGCAVKAMGRGHIGRLKENLRAKRR